MNASQTVFEYVLNNPHERFSDAVHALVERDIKRETVEALLHQMVRAKMLSRDKDDTLTALQKKYTPIQSTYARRSAVKPQMFTPVPASMTAKQVLETMTVKEAYTLHIALKEMFKG